MTVKRAEGSRKRAQRGGGERPRRRLKKRHVALALIALLVALSLFITRSGVLKLAVLPALESALGCDATARSVRVSLGGEVVISDLRLDVRGVPGPAASFLDAPRVVARISWGSVLSGEPRVTQLRLIRPTLRVSQHRETLAINLANLDPGGGAGAGAGSPPAIDLVDASIELGEHTDGSYAPLSTLVMGGRLKRSTEEEEVFLLSLEERPISPRLRAELGADADGRVVVTGRVDTERRSVSARVGGIDLAEWSRRRMPSSFQPVWERLAVSGSIPEVQLDFFPESGARAVVSLADVRMSVPAPTFDAAGRSLESERLLAMSGVSGTVAMSREGVEAHLRGLVEDLAIRVDFDLAGLTLDAPMVGRFSVDEFLLEERPRLLPFAPPIARQVLERFGGPTARVSGEVRIEREALGGAFDYEGVFELADGEGRYELFPYPLTDISATFVFDQDRFEIVGLSGRGQGDAQVLASGSIAPPGDGARVHLEINAIDVPLDDVFRDSMPEDRRQVFDVLFDRDAYERLEALGLLRSPERAASQGERLDELERLLLLAERGRALPDNADVNALEAERMQIERAAESPVFGLGGVAALNIVIDRPLGEDTRYAVDIGARIERAGMLPVAFEYPVSADDVRLRISDDVVTLEEAKLRGLSGAEGTIAGDVALLKDGGGVDPDLTIAARHVPIDAFLIQALPAGDDPDAGEPAFSPRSAMEDLGLRGSLVDMEVRIVGGETPEDVPPTDPDPIAFSVTGQVRDVASAPGVTPALTGVRGALTISSDEFAFREVSGRVNGAAFTAFVAGLFPQPLDGVPLSVSGGVSAVDFDVSIPIERIAERLAPEPMAVLSTVRERHRPAGRVDASLAFALEGDAEPDYELEIGEVERLEVTVQDTRLLLADVEGSLRVTPELIELQDVDGAFAAGAGAASPFTATGAIARRAGGERRLEVSATALPIEAELVRAVLAQRSPALHTLADELNLGGRVDVRGTLVSPVPRDGAPPDRGSDGGDALPVRLDTWSASPRRLTMTRRAVDIDLEATGSLSGAPGSVRIDALTLKPTRLLVLEEGQEQVREAWRLGISGAWTPEGLDVRADLEARALGEMLLALLPEGASATARAMELGLGEGGALRVEGARVTLAGAEENAPGTLDATLSFEGLEARVGLPITEAQGAARIRFDGTPGVSERLRVEADLPAFRAAGVRMTGGHASAVQRSEGSAIVLPRIDALSHGGRLVANAAIRPGAGPSGGAPAFELRAEVVRVSFAPLLDDLGLGEEEGESTPDRGLIDASLTLRGGLGESSERRGRTTIRVQGGRVLDMPGVIPLLELSNLQLPSNERVNLAFADMYVQGERALVERVALYSDSIRILGEGTINLDDRTMDLGVRTQGMRHIPVLSPLLEGIREEIVSTRITGSLYDPRLTTQQLRSTRDLLGAIVGEEGAESPRSTPPAVTRPERSPR
jgi:hypothetical protein